MGKDRKPKGHAFVCGMVEEERRFDELQFSDPKRPFVMTSERIRSNLFKSSVSVRAKVSELAPARVSASASGS